MKTLHLFKISEDSKKIEFVELICDELEKVFIVRWKWSNMNVIMSITYETWKEALEKYNERKEFIKMCN